MNSSVVCLQYNQNPKLLLVGGNRGTIAIYNLKIKTFSIEKFVHKTSVVKFTCLQGENNIGFNHQHDSFCFVSSSLDSTYFWRFDSKNLSFQKLVEFKISKQEPINDKTKQLKQQKTPFIQSGVFVKQNQLNKYFFIAGDSNASIHLFEFDIMSDSLQPSVLLPVFQLISVHERNEIIEDIIMSGDSIFTAGKDGNCFQITLNAQSRSLTLSSCLTSHRFASILKQLFWKNNKLYATGFFASEFLVWDIFMNEKVDTIVTKAKSFNSCSPKNENEQVFSIEAGGHKVSNDFRFNDINSDSSLFASSPHKKLCFYKYQDNKSKKLNFTMPSIHALPILSLHQFERSNQACKNIEIPFFFLLFVVIFK